MYVPLCRLFIEYAAKYPQIVESSLKHFVIFFPYLRIGQFLQISHLQLHVLSLSHGCTETKPQENAKLPRFFNQISGNTKSQICKSVRPCAPQTTWLPKFLGT